MESEADQEDSPMEEEEPVAVTTPMDTEGQPDLPKLISLNDAMWTFADAKSTQPPPPQSQDYQEFVEGFLSWFKTHGANLDEYMEVQQARILLLGHQKSTKQSAQLRQNPVSTPLGFKHMLTATSTGSGQRPV